MEVCDALPDGWIATQGCGQCRPCLARRVAELEAALRTIANTNGAQGVLAVKVAERALADH